jgi:hypothetical protein
MGNEMAMDARRTRDEAHVLLRWGEWVHAIAFAAAVAVAQESTGKTYGRPIMMVSVT